MLFDWLVVGHIMEVNPAHAVRGPKHVVKTGKTPVLENTEWRKLLDTIPTETVRDLRDRALIATLTYSFARIGAAVPRSYQTPELSALRATGQRGLIKRFEQQLPPKIDPHRPVIELYGEQ